MLINKNDAIVCSCCKCVILIDEVLGIHTYQYDYQTHIDYDHYNNYIGDCPMCQEMLYMEDLL